MKQNKTLSKVYKNKMDVLDAYNELYTHKVNLPKSHFIKVKLKIKEHPMLTGFVWLITVLPLPAFIVRFFLKRNKEQRHDFITTNEIMELVSTKHVYLEVITEDVYIKIKTI